MKFSNVSAEYSGGGVYLFTGKVILNKNTSYFFIDSDLKALVTLSKPFDLENIGESIPNVIKYYTVDESTNIFVELLNYILKSNLKGNYQKSDIERILKGVKNATY